MKKSHHFSGLLKVNVFLYLSLCPAPPPAPPPPYTHTDIDDLPVILSANIVFIPLFASFVFNISLKFRAADVLSLYVVITLHSLGRVVFWCSATFTCKNVPVLTLFCSQIIKPYRGMFIPVFLNCWLAKNAMQNMFVSDSHLIIYFWAITTSSSTS